MGIREIFCPPEIKFYKDLLCQFPNDPFAHGRLGSSIRALDIRTEVWLDEFGRALCRCYDIATRNAGKMRWADKDPENALNIAHWERLLGGRMAFILVVRHPFDVIASMAEIAMDKVIPLDVAGRAAHVRDYISAGLAFVDEHPERSMIVRYECLVSDPIKTLTELMSFLDEEFYEAMINCLHSGNHGVGLEDPKARHHANISISTVGRWRSELSGDQARIANRAVASLCRRLDYKI